MVIDRNVSCHREYDITSVTYYIYSVNVRCRRNNKIPYCPKCAKLFTSIINTTILVKIYKNNENKNYTNIVFKAKKNSSALSTKIQNVK